VGWVVVWGVGGGVGMSVCRLLMLVKLNVFAGAGLCGLCCNGWVGVGCCGGGVVWVYVFVVGGLVWGVRGFFCFLWVWGVCGMVVESGDLGCILGRGCLPELRWVCSLGGCGVVSLFGVFVFFVCIFVLCWVWGVVGVVR